MEGGRGDCDSTGVDAVGSHAREWGAHGGRSVTAKGKARWRAQGGAGGAWRPPVRVPAEGPMQADFFRHQAGGGGLRGDEER